MSNDSTAETMQTVKALSLADMWRLFIDSIAHYKELLEEFQDKLSKAADASGSEQERLKREAAEIEKKLRAVHESNRSALRDTAIFLIQDYIIFTREYLLFFLMTFGMLTIITALGTVIEPLGALFSIIPPWLVTFVGLMLLSMWFWRSMQILGRRLYPFVVSFLPGVLQYIYYLLFIPEEVSLTGFAAVFWSALTVIAISAGISMGAGIETLILVGAVMLLTFMFLFMPFLKNIPHSLGTALTLMVVTRALETVLENSLHISLLELNLTQSLVLITTLLLFVMWFDLMVHLMVSASLIVSWGIAKLGDIMPTIGPSIPEEVVKEVKEQEKKEIIEMTGDTLKNTLKKLVEKLKSGELGKNFFKVVGETEATIISADGNTKITVDKNHELLNKLKEADTVVREVETKAKDKNKKLLTVVSRGDEHWVYDKDGEPIGEAPIKGPFQKLGAKLAELTKDKGIGKLKSPRVVRAFSINENTGEVEGLDETSFTKYSKALKGTFGKALKAQGTGNNWRVSFDRNEHRKRLEERGRTSLTSPWSSSVNLMYPYRDVSYLLPTEDGSHLLINGLGDEKFQVGGMDVEAENMNGEQFVGFLNSMKDADEETAKKLLSGELKKFKGMDVHQVSRKKWWGGTERKVVFRKGNHKVVVNQKDFKKLVDKAKRLELGPNSRVIRMDLLPRRAFSAIREAAARKPVTLQIDDNRYATIHKEGDRFVARSPDLGELHGESISALTARMLNKWGAKRLKLLTGGPKPVVENAFSKDAMKTLRSVMGSTTREVNDNLIRDLTEKDNQELRKIIANTLKLNENDPRVVEEAKGLAELLKKAKGGKFESTILGNDSVVRSLLDKDGNEIYRTIHNKDRGIYTREIKGVGSRAFFSAGGQVITAQGASMDEAMDNLRREAEKVGQTTNISGEIKELDSWTGKMRKYVLKTPAGLKLLTVTHPSKAGDIDSKLNNIAQTINNTSSTKITLPTGQVVTVRNAGGGKFLIYDSHDRLLHSEALDRDGALGMIEGMMNRWVVKKDSQESDKIMESIQKMRAISNKTKMPGLMHMSDEYGRPIGWLETMNNKMFFNPTGMAEDWTEIEPEELSDLLLSRERMQATLRRLRERISREASRRRAQYGELLKAVKKQQPSAGGPPSAPGSPPTPPPPTGQGPGPPPTPPSSGSSSTGQTTQGPPSPPTTPQTPGQQPTSTRPGQQPSAAQAWSQLHQQTKKETLEKLQEGIRNINTKEDAEKFVEGLKKFPGLSEKDKEKWEDLAWGKAKLTRKEEQTEEEREQRPPESPAQAWSQIRRGGATGKEQAPEQPAPPPEPPSEKAAPEEAEKKKEEPESKKPEKKKKTKTKKKVVIIERKEPEEEGRKKPKEKPPEEGEEPGKTGSTGEGTEAPPEEEHGGGETYQEEEHEARTETQAFSGLEYFSRLVNDAKTVPEIKEAREKIKISGLNERQKEILEAILRRKEEKLEKQAKIEQLKEVKRLEAKFGELPSPPEKEPGTDVVKELEDELNKLKKELPPEPPKTTTQPQTGRADEKKPEEDTHGHIDPRVKMGSTKEGSYVERAIKYENERSEKGKQSVAVIHGDTVEQQPHVGESVRIQEILGKYNDEEFEKVKEAVRDVFRKRNRRQLRLTLVEIKNLKNRDWKNWLGDKYPPGVGPEKIKKRLGELEEVISSIMKRKLLSPKRAIRSEASRRAELAADVVTSREEAADAIEHLKKTFEIENVDRLKGFQELKRKMETLEPKAKKKAENTE